MLIEVTVLQQRSVFEPQILHLLQVLRGRQVGLAQNPRNPGTSSHLSGGGISSDVVFVLLGLNCLTHKVSSIIPTASSMPWSPRETSAHTLLLFSVSFPALPWALRCALCTPTCLLETPSTGVGALELKIYFFILFLSMCICEGGRVMCTRVWTAAEDRRGQPTEDTLEPSGTT